MRKYRNFRKMLILVLAAGVLLASCDSGRDAGPDTTMPDLYSVDQLIQMDIGSSSDKLFVVGDLHAESDGVYVLLGSGDQSTRNRILLLFLRGEVQAENIGKCVGRETIATGVLNSKGALEVEFLDRDDMSVAEEACY